MRKINKVLKKIWKGVKEVGKVLLAAIVIIVQALASPKRASQPESGGRSPRRDEEDYSDTDIVVGQEPNDEVIDFSSQDARANERDNEQNSNDLLDEQDLPAEDFSLENSWLDAQYKRDPNYSPLGISGLNEDKSQSFNSNYSLEIDSSLSLQRNSIDPKNFNNNSPEKQQNTPQDYNVNANIYDKLVLEKFVRDDRSLSFSPQELQSKLDAQSIKVDRYSGGNQNTVVVEYIDRQGNNHTFISSIDGKGNTTSLLLDSPAKKYQQSEKQLLTHPLPDARISSTFGPRTHPVTGEQQKPHKGIDLVQPKGTPVIAASSGTVSFAGKQRGYGNIVIVDHGGGRQTAYAHLDRISVKRGQPVSSGQKVGELGNTGVGTGPHLHFEVREKGQKVDPKPYIYGR